MKQSGLKNVEIALQGYSSVLVGVVLVQVYEGINGIHGLLRAVFQALAV